VEIFLVVILLLFLASLTFCQYYKVIEPYKQNSTNTLPEQPLIIENSLVIQTPKGTPIKTANF
jgi:hypothetical protein